jgi:hypothetical protein
METDAIPAEMPLATASAHTSSHKSAPMSRADLIPRGERRRRWTTEQKQMIAAASLAPGGFANRGSAPARYRNRATLQLAARAAGGTASCGWTLCPSGVGVSTGNLPSRWDDRFGTDAKPGQRRDNQNDRPDRDRFSRWHDGAGGRPN